MHKKFEFKLKNKKIKLNFKSAKIDKILMKFVGIYGNKKIDFKAKINIKFKNNLNEVNPIKKIKIEELKIDNLYDEKNSKCNYSDFYNFSSSSSSSSSSNDNSSKIYNDVLLFIKNIKLLINTENNNLEAIIFSLANTNIKKIKVKGKIY